MSATTPIEWCDSTVNPVMGCDGCELWNPNAEVFECYAGAIHNVRAGRPGYADEFLIPKLFPGRMAAAARWSDLRGKARLDKPWLDGMPRMIFISDMGDALSRGVPFEFLRDEIVLTVAGETWQKRGHIGLWLTKQPKRMAQFSRWLAEQGVPWPDSLWAMTSITANQYAYRIAHLFSVEGPVVRGVSAEPLHDGVDLWPWIWLRACASGHVMPENDVPRCPRCDKPADRPALSWLITGGSSGPNARPTEIQDVRTLMNQGIDARARVFVKQLGARPEFYGQRYDDVHVHPIRDRKGGDWNEWPADLRVREFPEAPLRAGDGGAR